MIKKLRLERFKGFREAELTLGPFTVLVGTNASGKSNIRDAFRFLHGIARVETVSEILGGSWGESASGWAGIRGGAQEASYLGSRTFALELSFAMEDMGTNRDATYRIEVDPGLIAPGVPRVTGERLSIQGHSEYIFDARPSADSVDPTGDAWLDVSVWQDSQTKPPVARLSARSPVLGQIVRGAVFVERRETEVVDWLKLAFFCQLGFRALRRMRFLDPDPESMRQPSPIGQTILSDRGENLSSVLQGICIDKARRQVLLEWLQVLTPMDVRNFQFQPDPTGKVLAILVEKGGRTTSAYSASDGTLRLLAIVAALLTREPGQFYFLEELENGLHPTRLATLSRFIEQAVSDGTPQIAATTHSPLLLGVMGKRTLEDAALTYRLEGDAEARIRRIVDIPDARRVLEEQDLGRLHESGWLENVVEFTADREVA